jgi:hypothetical protein
MDKRKLVSAVFLLIAIGLAVMFYLRLHLPPGNVEYYFDKENFNQFGPLAICVELFIAGVHLFRKHPKTNIALAVFGFTALLDPLFNTFGVFETNVPLYGSVIFVLCAVPALWIAFTNTFGSGKISFFWAMGSFLLGLLIELFFNYW